MPDQSRQPDLFTAHQQLRLCVTLLQVDGVVQVTWSRWAENGPVAEVKVRHETDGLQFYPVSWRIDSGGKTAAQKSMVERSSIRARLNALRKAFPVADADFSAMAQFGESVSPIELPVDISPWL